MKPDTKTDIQILLEEYDKEFGLEIGNSRELEDYMVHIDSNMSLGLIGEIEREYKMQNRWKKFYCMFTMFSRLFRKKKQN